MISILIIHILYSNSGSAIKQSRCCRWLIC